MSPRIGLHRTQDTPEPSGFPGRFREAIREDHHQLTNLIEVELTRPVLPDFQERATRAGGTSVRAADGAVLALQG
jgi:hypothetical protein